MKNIKNYTRKQHELIIEFMEESLAAGYYVDEDMLTELKDSYFDYYGVGPGECMKR